MRDPTFNKDPDREECWIVDFQWWHDTLEASPHVLPYCAGRSTTRLTANNGRDGQAIVVPEYLQRVLDRISTVVAYQGTRAITFAYDVPEAAKLKPTTKLRYGGPKWARYACARLLEWVLMHSSLDQLEAAYLLAGDPAIDTLVNDLAVRAGLAREAWTFDSFLEHDWL